MTNSIPIWLVFLIAFLAFDFILVAYVFFKKLGRDTFDSKELQYIKSHWIRIIDMFNTNSKASILDADKLLDYALGKKGFDGNLGEKLKKGGARFSDVNEVWMAHKLRNKIAHELGDIDVAEARRALKYFKRALNDLGAHL